MAFVHSPAAGTVLVDIVVVLADPGETDYLAAAGSCYPLSVKNTSVNLTEAFLSIVTKSDHASNRVVCFI
jgi:hypothetical protein